jgi:hypothetical protein
MDSQSLRRPRSPSPTKPRKRAAVEWTCDWPLGPAFDLAPALATGVALQKRTGRHKQFVLRLPDDDAWVYKGPYAAARVQPLAERFDTLRTWALPDVVLPDRTLFPMAGHDAQYFLRFPNIAPGPVGPTEPNRESFSEYTYLVAQRTTAVKAREVYAQAPAPAWAVALIPRLAAQLVALATLRVGDIHLSNILADTVQQRMYIIDVEETRTRLPDGPLAIFTTMPQRATAALWMAELRANYEAISAAVAALPINHMAAEAVLVQLCGETDEVSPAAPDVPTAAPAAPDVPTAAPAEARGHMRAAGPFRSYTYSGFKTDEAKSGLQKYVRRGEVDKALIMAFELWRFNGLVAEAASAKGIVTNLCNRLCVIACEDVGPADLPLVLETLATCSAPP